jgi:hypothetical protein
MMLHILARNKNGTRATKISVILLATFIILSVTVVSIAVKMVNNPTDDGYPEMFAPGIPFPKPLEKIPLTNAQINATWPNLPTAKQIYEKWECSFMHVTSKDPLPVNCTETGPNYMSGGFVTVTNIWLQYNSSRWIGVPYHYLNTTIAPDGVFYS